MIGSCRYRTRNHFLFPIFKACKAQIHLFPLSLFPHFPLFWTHRNFLPQQIYFLILLPLLFIAHHVISHYTGYLHSSFPLRPANISALICSSSVYSLYRWHIAARSSSYSYRSVNDIFNDLLKFMHGTFSGEKDGGTPHHHNFQTSTLQLWYASSLLPTYQCEDK